jgi:hypothetical protein
MEKHIMVNNAIYVKIVKASFIQCLKYVKLTITQKEQISALLLERISLESILRFLKIPAYHLYTYMDKLYNQTLYNLNIPTLVSHCKEIDLQCFECENNEAWSFVGHKSNKQGYGSLYTGKAVWL